MRRAQDDGARATERPSMRRRQDPLREPFLEERTVREQVVPLGAVQEEDRGGSKGDDDEQGADVGALRPFTVRREVGQSDGEGQGQVHLDAVQEVESKCDHHQGDVRHRQGQKVASAPGGVGLHRG